MEEETKNNEYEAKKQEREEARAQERRRTQVERGKRKVVRYGVWLIILAALGYGVFLLGRTPAPEGDDFSVVYPDQGRDHIPANGAHPAYNSNPPSSGWHYAAAARGGFYDSPLPDEQVVHNLEHGDIWIAYHPDISDAAKEILESFAGRYVVVSPRSDNEGALSLVAWTRVDTFDIENDVVDEGRIIDFIRRYDNRGPEKLR